MKVESSQFFDCIVRKTVTFETTIMAKSGVGLTPSWT